MFLSKMIVVYLSVDYSNFIRTFTWYKMLCGIPSFEKKMYVEGFRSLQEAYHEVKKCADIEGESDALIQDLFDQISKLLRRRKFSDDTVFEIGIKLGEFEREHYDKVVHAGILRGIVNREERLMYHPALREQVSKLFVSEAHDEIVLNAFKFLDKYLQQLLSLSPNEAYGEGLINQAFSPDSGLLQMDTHINEQIGLRNFVSGVNAVFRNPTAHRQLLDSGQATFRGDGDFYASAVVVLTELIARISTELYAKKIDPQMRGIFQKLIDKSKPRTGWKPVALGTTGSRLKISRPP